MLDAVGSWIGSPEDELRVSIALAVDEPTNAYNALWSLVRARRPAAALE